MPLRETSTLFEQLPIGAYRSSVDGKLLKVNAAFLRLNGYSSEEEMQRHLQDHGRDPYVHPQRREKFAELILAQGQVTNFVSEVYRLKTGERIWVREHAHVMLGEDGKVLYFEGTMEDITRERASRAAMRKSEALLRNVLQTIPDQVWLKDIDGIYLTCNDAFASQLGITPADIIGTRDAHWVEESVAETFLVSDHWAIQAGRSVMFEENSVTTINPKGHLFEVTKTPMRDNDGNVIGVLGMSRNIQERKVAEALLRDTTEQLELAIMGADLGRWDHDLTNERGYFLDARSCHMLGRDPRESEFGRAWGHLVHPDDLSTAMQAMRGHLTGNSPAYQAEYRARHTDGRWIWLSSRGKVVQFSKDGAPQRMVGTLMDISGRKQAEAQLHATQAELEATLKALPDLLFECSAAGHYRAVHSQNNSLLERQPELLLGRLVSDILPKDAADTCMAALREAQATGSSYGKQYSLELHAGKQWFELSVVRKPTVPGEEERFIAIARDITERKNAEEVIRHLAFHDTLTGLPNRRLLTDRLQQALGASHRKGEHGALMFLDLDQFKLLNDTHGHDVGDLLLQEVARRLQQSIRAVDTVARLGGDEFVVLIQDLSAEYEEARLHATTVGHKILASLNDPYLLNTHLYTTSPSIGITLFKGEGMVPSDVLKQADTAMYQAKADGRNTLCFYQP
ncbi:diguanylate cyclase domain-containing protein [Rhodoferax saidenbachensis]|uniref:Diguanylate cyclase (GGDEF)-like protein/PAS domain S-box-containing protein n=1 Tax=Rhodoferax saidenbachensis TaxID=1484693 RepID=A0ABU1ZKK4_9BURK|nr:diguanylate cyclase [Rhodoferax saidenbachensis]MDR7305071.1 diguanylate cyclase (GGDEF)-like protein/PAS domain S-box-containing protein [Rhodoferax saidenbachensis]